MAVSNSNLNDSVAQQILPDEKIGQILLTKEQISSCIQHLSCRITQEYADSEKVIVVSLLTGAKYFTNDLFSIVKCEKFKIHYVQVSSYNNSLKSSGSVEISGFDKINFCGENVLIVDDIYDSGLTMSALLALIKNQNPKSVRTCVLLNKNVARKQQIEIDFKGFDVPDCFVVGYGLDYKGQYRDLQYIAKLEVSG